MSSPIKTVALFGAAGALGPAVLKEFLSSSFKVTVITRPESQAKFPAGVIVVKSDYSLEALTAALAGQDAVVSLVGTPGFGAQKVMVEAAIAAGVKRFIPSEYGCDTSSPAVLQMVPFLNGKRQIAEYLQTKESAISWTALYTGPFFDWGLEEAFLGFDIPARKAVLWDGGEIPFTTTNLRTVGKALVALLGGGYAQTKNQNVHVASHETTQKEILASLERATGAKFAVTTANSEQKLREASEKIARGDYSDAYDLLKGAVYGKDELTHFATTWNERLRLPSEDLDVSVKAVVDGKA